MLFRCLKNLSLLALILAAVSGAYAGDLKVASVIRLQNVDAYSSVRYYRGERMRLEWQEHMTWKPGLITYGPRRAVIYQCDAQRVIELNLEAHKFSTAELNDECRGKNAPPLPEPKGTVSIYMERTDTGERRQILGRTAHHIITHERQVAGPQACWSDAEMDWDGWYIDMPEQPSDKKLRGHIDEPEPLIRSGANCRDKIEVHRTGIEKPGFAVKGVRTSRSWKPQPDGSSKEYTTRVEFEVTELSEAPLDAALFDLPANFSKVAKIDAQPSVPFSVEVECWWNDVVHTVSSWF